MKQNYTPIIKQDGDWWIGWIEEVPGVNCQEASKTALLISLRATLLVGITLKRAEEGPIAARCRKKIKGQV